MSPLNSQPRNVEPEVVIAAIAAGLAISTVAYGTARVYEPDKTPFPSQEDRLNPVNPNDIPNSTLI